MTYSWDFGDTSALVTTENASRTYTTEGSKTVTLTVSDGKGGSDTDTVTVNPTAPEPTENAAPTATITDASCAELDLFVQGGDVERPRRRHVDLQWDFGDTSPEVTTANASHTYASPGARTVTLTVNDGQGHIDTDTVTAPTDDGDPASQVTYVGSASSAGNRSTHTVTLPSGVNEGDTMVLFLGAASIAPTYPVLRDGRSWRARPARTCHGRARLDEDGDRGGRGGERQGQRHLLGDLRSPTSPSRSTGGRTAPRRSRAPPPRSTTPRVPRTPARPSPRPTTRAGW